MAEIACRNLLKRYGSAEVVPDFSLEVANHEFVVFLGPSGCGKSTILRMIAGLEAISGGELSIDGRVVNDLEPGDRGIAMVFQNYALYPHMTIYENIAFGLRRLKIPKAEIDRRVGEVVGMLSLQPYVGRKPTELSGGQQQRVAIARAMIKTPKVFLFDEPLSNLDAKLRAQMRIEIARLHKSLKTTTVYVTHDQLEAMTLADRIVLLNAGRIEQIGTPEDIYRHPQTLFVASFIGTPAMNLIPVNVRQRDGIQVLHGQGWEVSILGDRFDCRDGQDAVLGIRPADFSLSNSSGASIQFEGIVDMSEFHGDQILLSLLSGRDRVSALVPARKRVLDGERVVLGADEEDIHLFDAESGTSLMRTTGPRRA